MDLLAKLLDVSLVLGVPQRSPRAPAFPIKGDGKGGGEEESDGANTIIPHQPLQGRLTITCDNTSGSKTGIAEAFLSQVGEHHLPLAWQYLLQRLTVVPFLLDRADVDDGDRADSGRERPCHSHPLRLSASALGTSEAQGGAFVFGVPTFWKEKLFAYQDDDDDDDYYDDAVAGVAVGGGGSYGEGRDTGGGGWLPCRAAGEAFEVSAAGAKTVITPAASSCSSTTVPAKITSTYDFEFTVPDVSPAYLGRPASLAFVLLLSPLSDPPPRQSGTAIAPLAPAANSHPSVGCGDWLPHQRRIAMQVLSRASVNPCELSEGGSASLYSLHTILLGCQYLPVTVKRVLACRSATCPLSNDRLLLNLNIVNVSRSPVILHSASLDVYSTCTTAAATTADPPSSRPPRAERRRRWGGDRPGGRPPPPERRALQQRGLWAEQRAGPAGADMRTVDVLTKIVTVTPMVVSDDRPPFTLHAGETYSFQFFLEVLPQLCYLLNPKSLQYVYARYAQQQQQQQRTAGECSREDDGGAKANGNGGSAMKGCGSPAGAAGAVSGSCNSFEAVIQDCYGEAVSNEEILSVLSATYVSSLFVYYDVAVDQDGSGDGHEDRVMSGRDSGDRRRAAVVKADGLHLRHAATWSFGAA